MNVFQVIGPVMIGPSSSHTAGAVRIGNVAAMLLGQPPVSARILLHGSFAKTYKGHGTDKALIAGILGLTPSDDRIRTSMELAKEQGLSYSFEKGDIAGAHPNTVRIALTDKEGRGVTVDGASVGGGNISITRINGWKLSFSGQYTTFMIVHKDQAGMIAKVTDKLADEGVNINNFSLRRDRKGGTAVMSIEVDGTVPSRINDAIKKIDGVLDSTILKPLAGGA